jgi:hypothetical protein
MTREVLRRRSGWRVVPSAQVAEDLLHHPRVVNDGDDPHWVLANGAAERVHVPDPQDQVAPPLGRQLHRRWRRKSGAAENQLRCQAPLAHAAHLVAVPPVVADHLSSLVGNVLSDGGQEVRETRKRETGQPEIGTEAARVVGSSLLAKDKVEWLTTASRLVPFNLPKNEELRRLCGLRLESRTNKFPQ